MKSISKGLRSFPRTAPETSKSFPRQLQKASSVFDESFLQNLQQTSFRNLRNLSPQIFGSFPQSSRKLLQKLQNVSPKVSSEVSQIFFGSFRKLPQKLTKAFDRNFRRLFLVSQCFRKSQTTISRCYRKLAQKLQKASQMLQLYSQ